MLTKLDRETRFRLEEAHRRNSELEERILEVFFRDREGAADEIDWNKASPGELPEV